MLQPGDIIDIWVVERALGSGGMGSVYRCHNRDATRILAAIKVLDDGLSRYPEARARFIREAEILFQLDHPHIVKVRNVRTDTNPPYLEMEFVLSESLEDRLARGPMSATDGQRILRQLLSAVGYLHELGIRHRDIKPANVLIRSDGAVKLVDFGLAMESDRTRITRDGISFGTVSYAPPEWITPDRLDPTSWDLYAIGVLAFEMLSGSVAFPVSGQGNARQQALQVMIAKQGHAPLDPGETVPDVVRSLVRDLTSSSSEHRPRSAAEALARLDGNVALAPGTRATRDPIRDQATRPLAPTANRGSSPPNWWLRGALATIGVGGAAFRALAAIAATLWVSPRVGSAPVAEPVASLLEPVAFARDPVASPPPGPVAGAPQGPVALASPGAAAAGPVADVPANVAPPVPRVAEDRVPPTPAPAASPAPHPAAASGLVTNTQFARFLTDRADLHREAMVASGASESYLLDWQGATPPTGRDGQFVVNVSWKVAADYCRSRGERLPAMEDAPTTWDATATAPMAELRRDASGSPIALLSTGETLSTRMNSVVPDAGFRCLR